jgi:hypothetical protein
VKLGGVNAILEPPTNSIGMKWLNQVPTMVLGDTSASPLLYTILLIFFCVRCGRQPPRPRCSPPSITALVSSVDGNVSYYFSSVSVQEHHVETIQDLASMMRVCTISIMDLNMIN